MLIYIDTNILIAFWNNKDKFFDQCQLILNQGDMQFVTSIYAVVEFESVMGRMWHKNEIEFDESFMNVLGNLTEPQQIKMITKICFGKINVHIISIASIETFNFNNIDYHVENILQENYDVNAVLRLRTLDALHITTAFKIKQMTPLNLDYFLTNDQDILENGAIIRRTVNIIPVSTDELIQTLKLDKD
jgi:predicted nucleic acid-binding protein